MACFGFASPEVIHVNLASLPTLAKIVEGLTGLNPASNDFPELTPAFLEALTKGLFNELDKDPAQL